jgi:putative CocE/NonD family hydrolase
MKALLHRMAPAGDGVGLATDVYLPAGPGPFPTILVRTPYHRTGLQGQSRPFVERGYAFVAQDCRGKYDSEGRFTPLVDEAADGKAALDWVAGQSWCNGRVGLWGRSYLGIVQMPAAAGGHEVLKCIAPSVAPGSYFRDWLRYDGCFALANAVSWSLTHATCRTQPAMQHFDWGELHRLDGIEAIAERVGFSNQTLQQWAEHDTSDDMWRGLDWDHLYAHVDIPGFHSGGWFDHLTRTQFESFGALRGEQKLLIGPWGHKTVSLTGPAHTRYGDWDFGNAADLDLLAAELQFFDAHLRDIDDGYSDLPAVRVFLMGQNRWVSIDDWPPPAAREQALYLDAGGRLRLDTPDVDGDDGYRYDPRDPVPTRGGSLYWGLKHVGPVDVRKTLQRPDALCYRGDVLRTPLTVIGDIALELHVASDAEDSDFIARLCVETDGGAVTCLTQGQQRCRFRNDPSVPEPLEANTPTRLSLPMGQMAYTFAAGSRVVLLVTSSDFPRILPHRNRMAPLWEGDPVVAHQHVLRGPASPSRLLMPVVDGGIR